MVKFVSFPNAFALARRNNDFSEYPGRCPGLCAVELSAHFRNPNPISISFLCVYWAFSPFYKS